MSQTETGKATAADERTEAARSFVRTVKAATRRKYTPEEKIRIVLEGFRREVTVSDLCRREGIKPHSYYSWTKEFMEAGKERLTRDTVRDATREEVHQLKRENGELNPNPPMDGARTGEGGKGVTGAMIRARIRVDGRLAGGLQALLGAPMSACSGCGERDGRIGHGKRRSRTGMA